MPEETESKAYWLRRVRAVAAKPVADSAPARLEIDLDDSGALDYLTTPSIFHMRTSLKDFVNRVLREARSIEKAEHVGTGPPEITAAHIDEAWWVTRRRIRRTRHPILRVIARVVQLFGVAGFGIGATHLQTTWGPGLFVVSAGAIIMAFLTEAYLARSD